MAKVPTKEKIPEIISEEPYWLTQAWLMQADFNDVQRRSMAKTGLALPDGSFPIRNKTDLGNAIRAIGRAKDRDRAKKHIIKRARSLGAMSMLPESWGVTQEMAKTLDTLAAEQVNLSSYLILGQDGVAKPDILQEASTETNGRMRIRVPFYVGDSIAHAPGFSEKLFFPKAALVPIVTEANNKILENKQPLTVYARHAHAVTADYLPIGAVVETLVGEDGRTGYAVMDILDTDPHGKNAQKLIKAGMLNAVSLRTDYGNYTVEKKRINGEAMLQANITSINGIDFAPDGPAQPTYGIQVLMAEASVEPFIEPEATPVVEPVAEKSSPKSKRSQNMDELKLEDVKARPDIVEQIVAPVKAQLSQVREELVQSKDGFTSYKLESEKKVDALTKELETLKTEKAKVEVEKAKVESEKVAVMAERDNYASKETIRLRDEKIKEIAGEFPEPEKALPILVEGCKDAKTADDVTKFAYPIMLELFKARREKEKETPKATPLDQLLEMFTKPSGAGITQETPANGIPALSPEERVHRVTFGGLVTPE
jgi:hypothetical protein